MKRIRCKWFAYYGDKGLELSFPNSLSVKVNPIHDSPAISVDKIESSLRHPVDAQPLRKLAKGRKEAVVLIDDLTRPAPTHRVLPSVLHELKKGGIGDDRVRIVVALGGHRPLDHTSLVRKVGIDVVTRVEIYNHNPLYCLEHIGDTSSETPLYVNKEVMECDLKVGINSIVPSGDGFTGGAKIILPGVSGMDTIHHDHNLVKFASYAQHRANWEEAAGMVGLDFCGDIVVNSSRGVAGFFAGDYVSAHKLGETFAKEVYATNVDENVDVAVVNGYPQDTQLSIRMLPNFVVNSVREGGTVVLVAACPEGVPTHYYYSKWGAKCAGKGYTKPEPLPGHRKLVVFSPLCSEREVHRVFPESTSVFKTWKATLGRIRDVHGARFKVSVYPCGPIQRPIRHYAEGES